MTTTKFTGKIETGQGHGRFFMQMPWVKKQIIDKMSFNPYPGTLNMILIDRDVTRYNEFIKKAKGAIIEPIDTSFFQGKCIRTVIEETVEGAVVIPLMPGYPKNKVEIISHVYLREHLYLLDGDLISIYFSQ